MNAKVEEFINKKKDELREKELIKREKHLISLGLIDENKTKRGIVYLDKWDGTKDCKFDKDKNKYYKESYVPIAVEITDEEYQEILKYAPEELVATQQKKAKTTWGDTIEIIAYWYLVLCIIATIFLFYDSGLLGVTMLLSTTVTFPFIMGVSKIVSAAEKYLQK